MKTLLTLLFTSAFTIIRPIVTAITPALLPGNHLIVSWLKAHGTPNMLIGNMVALFVGDPGVGKTTISYMYTHARDTNLQLKSYGNLRYYQSPHIFFVGRNTTDLTSLSSYHINDPKSYIIEWLESANRPKVFVGDGDRFSDITFWCPLVAYGLQVMIFHLVCNDGLLLRHEHRLRGFPYTWHSISARYDALISWQQSNVQVISVDTQLASAYTCLIDIVIHVVGEPLPPKHAIIIPQPVFGLWYEIIRNAFGTNVLSFLRMYAQQQMYMKEEGLVSGTLRQKPRGIRVEGNIGCGIAYRGMSVDSLAMHPMLRYVMEALSYHWDERYNSVQMVALVPNACVDNGDKYFGMDFHSDSEQYLSGLNKEYLDDITVTSLNLFTDSKDEKWSLLIKAKEPHNLSSDDPMNAAMDPVVETVTFGDGDFYKQPRSMFSAH